jgi:hypothetical protein
MPDLPALTYHFQESSAMPRGTQLKDFGQEFEVLLRRVDKAMSSGHDEFSIDFAEQKIADALRFRIYKYFKALRSCGDRPDLVPMCEGVSMRVAGCTLHFYRRGDDKDAAALRNALGIDRSPPIATPSTLESNLELLKQIRREKS